MSAQELAEMLYRRFKGVPGFTEEEAQDLVLDAMRAHDYAPSDSVKPDEINLVLLYAQYNGAWQIALSVADRKSTRLNYSHVAISSAVSCLKKKIGAIKHDSLRQDQRRMRSR